MPKNKVIRLSPPEATMTEARTAFRLVQNSHKWAYGPKAKAVEKYLAKHLGIPEDCVIATMSCTHALEAAKYVFFPEGGFRVSPLTWPATYMVPAGIDPPTFVDVDPTSGWPLEPVDIAVDLWGRPSTSLPCTILDSAHRFLAPEHADILHQGLAKAVTYSFAPQKELPCFVGGALCFSPQVDDLLLHEARMYLNCGTLDREPVLINGTKGLMPDIAAAMIWENLRRHRYVGQRKKREDLLREYEKLLGPSMLTQPGYHNSSGHLCVLNFPERDLVTSTLTSRSIEWSIHYPIALPEGVCCNAKALADSLLTVPLHVGMSPQDVRRVCYALLRPLGLL